MRPPLQKPTTYDIEQEQQRHDDAIHWYGEMTAFLQWWNIQDFEDGLVTRCSTCYTSYGEIADAYGQSSENKCPACFGTTFEGGLKAIYYRPAIWDTTDIDMGIKKRGFVDSNNGSIQIMSNTQVRKGDCAVRADGTRWELTDHVEQEITTGFGSQKGVRPMRTKAKVTMQDPTSVVYLPAVDLSALDLVGWMAYLPHSPHPLDAVAPTPVITPTGTGRPGSLVVQRGREFTATLVFYTDTSRQARQDVSGNTYGSQFRLGASALSTVVNTLQIDMSRAAVGEVRVWLSSTNTDDIVQNSLYWDVFQVVGAENISIISPYIIDVV